MIFSKVTFAKDMISSIIQGEVGATNSYLPDEPRLPYGW